MRVNLPSDGGPGRTAGVAGEIDPARPRWQRDLAPPADARNDAAFDHYGVRRIW